MLVRYIINHLLSRELSSQSWHTNILIRLKALNNVGYYVSNKRCRAFRKVGSTRLNFAPFHTFKASNEEVIVFKDKHFDLRQIAEQHY